MLGRCNDCREDTGNWFGDCLSCGLGFFRQQDAASCLPDCPTGSIGSILTGECEGLGLGAISSVFFDKIGVLYKGLPFGLYRLETDNIFDLRPFNTITRGVYFNGLSGHIKISGIILNTNFSVHFWVYFFDFKGDLLKVEAETPTTNDEEQEMTYTCGGSPSNENEADVGCNYNGGDTQTASTEGNVQLESWVDFNMIAKFNDVDSTMDITFNIGGFNLDITIAGNPFHMKPDTDIIFCKECHAFVLNFKLFN